MTNARSVLGRRRLAGALLALLLSLAGTSTAAVTHTAPAAASVQSVPVPTAGCGVINTGGRIITQWRIPGGCDFIGYGGVAAVTLAMSPNGQYRAVYQAFDGNLVVYNAANVALWHSQTWGHPNSIIRFQYDGNVVIYENGSTVLWAADPYFGAYGKMTFEMQDDSNLVIYNGNHYPYWSWHTGVCYHGGPTC